MIEDVDDETPKCNYTEYRAEVMENSQNLIPIKFTSASDLYVFDNDEVTNHQINMIPMVCCMAKMF